jgi:hypothetical protein
MTAIGPIYMAKAVAKTIDLQDPQYVEFRRASLGQQAWLQSGGEAIYWVVTHENESKSPFTPKKEDDKFVGLLVYKKVAQPNGRVELHRFFQRHFTGHARLNFEPIIKHTEEVIMLGANFHVTNQLFDFGFPNTSVRSSLTAACA